MFIYRSRFLTRGEVWFDEEPDGTSVDWIYHRQRSAPLSNCSGKPYYTRLVDLQKTPAVLFEEIEEKTRRKITEAREKDKLRCECCDSTDKRLINELEEMWNAFAVAQKTPLLERSWLDRIAEAGKLDLTAARTPKGEALAYHLVLLTPARGRQLIAISPYKSVPSIGWRTAVSRANCLLHWHNFQKYQARGIRSFDFGGWYPGSNDIKLLGMNAFKKGFGGKVVLEFDCEQPVTLKGRVALLMVRTLARLKELRHSARTDLEGPCRAPRTEEQKVSPAFQ